MNTRELTPLEAERRLRARSVAELAGFSRATLYRRVAEGKFPAPRHDGRCVYWRAGDILIALRPPEQVAV